ncbi:hypothetical protein [Caballeronia sp. HLA56]
MYRIGGYIVECLVEEYQDGWRCVVRVFRNLPSATRREISAQYSVPALFPSQAMAERAAYIWGRRLIEANRNIVEFALENAEMDDASAVRD